MNDTSAQTTVIRGPRVQCLITLGLVLALIVANYSFAVPENLFANAGPATPDQEQTAAQHLWQLVQTHRDAVGAVAVLLLGQTLFILWHLASQHRAGARPAIATADGTPDDLIARNKELEILVHYDAMTGLPNGRLMLDHLCRLLDDRSQDSVNVVYVDLDDFKAFNETYGHAFGDSVICTVAEKLRHSIDAEDMIARIEGDDFVIITAEQADIVVKRVMRVLADIKKVDGRQLKIKASVGFVTADATNWDPHVLLADARRALQVAQDNGGNRAQGHHFAMRECAEKQRHLQMELPLAIATGQIEAWMQPQVRLSDGAIHGVEVLGRWRHPTHGLLTPDIFLPAAVQAGLMVELDHAIWRSALEQAGEWHRAGVDIPFVSLNAAPETISDPNLIERFLLQLHHSGMRPDQVVIEVLETTIITGKDDLAAMNIDSLAECGVALELDDFGTGYASLARLTQLPLTGIKLDRSLVTPLPDKMASSVIRAIVALAYELNLQVIAEGIEEEEQTRALIDMGCTVGQGYRFARPMSPEQIKGWFAQNPLISATGHSIPALTAKRA